MLSLRKALLGCLVCGSVGSGPGVSEQLCNENRSGGLGKLNEEAAEFTVEDREESRGRFRLWSKDDSGSSAEQGGELVSAWSCAAGAADTSEGGGAMYVGVVPPL